MATATPPLAVVCYRFSWTLTAHRVLPPPCTPVRLHSPREINMQEAAPGRPLPISPFPTISPCAAPFFFNPAPIALLSALFCLPSTLPYRSSPLCPSAPPNIPSGCVPTLFLPRHFGSTPLIPPSASRFSKRPFRARCFLPASRFCTYSFRSPPACWGVLAISGTAMRRTSLVPSFSSLLRAESTSRQDFSGCEFPPRFPFRASLLLAGRLSRLRRAPALFRSPANFDCIDSRSLVRVRCELARPAVVLRRRSQAGGGCRRISFTFTQQRRYRWNGR